MLSRRFVTALLLLAYAIPIGLGPALHRHPSTDRNCCDHTWLFERFGRALESAACLDIGSDSDSPRWHEGLRGYLGYGHDAGRLARLGSATRHACWKRTEELPARPAEVAARCEPVGKLADEEVNQDHLCPICKFLSKKPVLVPKLEWDGCKSVWYAARHFSQIYSPTRAWRLFNARAPPVII